MLTSCNYDGFIKKWTPKEESEFAKDYLERLRNHDFEYVRGVLNSELMKKADDELMTKTADHFRGREPMSTELIGWRVNVVNGQWNGSFSFEYEFAGGWNLATTTLRKLDSGYEVTGFRVFQTAASQREINAFTLGSKSLAHYAVLSVALLVPMFVLVSFIVCIRTPIPKRKWLWLLFVFVGLGMFQLNWTTGQYAVKLFYFQLFGAGAVKSGPYAPWMLSVSLPVGALAFWQKRKRLMTVEAVPDVVGPVPPQAD